MSQAIAKNGEPERLKALRQGLLWIIRRDNSTAHLALDAAIERGQQILFAGEVMVNDTRARVSTFGNQRHGSMLQTILRHQFQRRLQNGLALIRFLTCVLCLHKTLLFPTTIFDQYSTLSPSGKYNTTNIRLHSIFPVVDRMLILFIS